MTITWFERFVPVRGSNRRPARIATPSGGGGCMVMRAASNGGASGRVWARTATKFPASKISATNVNAAFHRNLQAIAILRGVRPFEWISGKAYFYTLADAFQTKNTSPSRLSAREHCALRCFFRLRVQIRTLEL